MENKIEFNLVPYSSDYPSKFINYKKKILQQLNSYRVEVHHIGSTAVEGLGGKGLIDILIALPTWDDENEIICKLKSLGFTHIHKKEDERIFLSKPPEDVENYDVHLHLALIGSRPYKEMIYFRDSLRNSPQLTKEYFELKVRLLKSTGANRKKYTSNKAEFIERICKQVT